jgi:hypothetical protein
VLKICGVGILVLALAGCGAPRARQAASAAPPAPENSASAAGLPPHGKVYRVDEQVSELRVLVYRAGPLARLGHNHVLVNREIHGSVTLADAAAAARGSDATAAGASSFSLSVPVAGFVVDDAQARREEGADFAAEVPDDARAGTLRNMQSTAVLDADEFPAITVSGVDVAQGTAAVAINVAGHESKIDVPFALRMDSGHLVASGSVELRQSALGMKPYSLMLGALQVQDALTVKFKIVADL